MGQLSDPYNQGEQDDDVEITLSGLPSDDEPFGAPEVDELDDEKADLIADDEGMLDDAVNASGDEAESEIEESLHVEDDEGVAVDESVDAVSDDDDFVDEDEAAADSDTDGEEDDEDEDGESDGEDEIAYDLAEWEDNRLDLLFDRLEEEGIGYLWDGEELFVREGDEADVDRVLEEVSNPDALRATDTDGDAGGVLLGELFVVADILRHDPDDNEASMRLLELDRTAEGAEPPYGLAEPEWNALREKVKAAADLLLVDGDIDGDAVIEAADQLRTVIRPYV